MTIPNTTIFQHTYENIFTNEDSETHIK